ncbi:MAG: CPBP family intramembrane metalloprotease [Clostridia bacterium]|nr:CPBP family intramembrane metalloprotease [Clostridia bacterium]
MEATHDNLSILKVLFLVFVPTSLLTLIYILAGYLQNMIPSLLLFFLLAMFILFPIEVWVVLHASKKKYGSYSLKSAFSNHQKLPWWTIFLYGFLLWGFAGIMSVTIAPLENMLFAPISSWLTSIIPEYFDWNNMGYLKQYSKNILMLTCVVYFILNVFIGPIVEEIFFRGYLTSKISRYGKYAPIIITVLFSMYHFWLPFNNLFRFVIFFPAAYFSWKKKNIYISIVFHCLCNLFSVISFIVAVYTI